MITLQTLKWDNCFSYGAGNELRLDDNTVTQILGTNGMGKSSIPLIKALRKQTFLIVM